jgi:hypothetical protein
MNKKLVVKIKKHIYSKGVSIIETVVYITMLMLLTAVVMSSLISLFKSYSVIKAQQDIELSAIQILDKLTRDIRDTTGVVLAESSFNVPQGALALTIVNGTSTDVYTYYAASSTLKVSKNGVYLGDLSQTGVLVDSFVLRQVVGSSVAANAIKIELNLQGVSRYSTSTISKNFYTTVQQRN